MFEKLKNNSFVKSFESTLDERMWSSMYGTFIITWIIANWQAIYTTLFIDQELIFKTYNLLKIDYVWLYFYGWGNFTTYWKLFFEPIIFTYLIIWFLSKIELICFKKNYTNKINQRNAAIEEEEKLLQKEKNLEENRWKILDKKEENIDKEKKIEKEITNEEKWEDDFIKLRTWVIFTSSMHDLRRSIYEFNWRTRETDNFNREVIFQLTSEQTSYLHVNGLIDFQDGTGNQIIELTEKWKFFMKRYIEIISS